MQNVRPITTEAVEQRPGFGCVHILGAPHSRQGSSRVADHSLKNRPRLATGGSYLDGHNVGVVRELDSDRKARPVPSSTICLK